MKIEYDPPKKRQPVFALFKLIIRPFVRRPRVVALGEKLQDGCMYIANHANKMGPMIYSMFLPVYHVKWGASQMLGSYKERFYYLRDVLYIQKNGSPHALASFRAFFEAFFSAFVYKGMKMLPTYPDGRLARTVKKTAELLAQDIAVMIFPEDSKNGYEEQPQSFFPGFVLAAKTYAKQQGRDIPMRPVYYHKRKRLIVVGEAVTLSSLPSQKKEDVAEELRLRVNGLCERILSGEFYKLK